ncbi:hypothetical protein JTB14_002320 [Gonioctena quinquepunctata]|nr:hypothetical protein JTB14_002320 [Gonioctena quinquepunctata]
MDEDAPLTGSLYDTDKLAHGEKIPPNLKEYNEAIRKIHQGCLIENDTKTSNVYWWNADIANKRKEWTRHRREITRKRGNRNTNPREIEEAEVLYKKPKQELRKLINESKKKCWQERPRKRHMGRRLQNRHETPPILCAILLDQTIKSKSRNRTFPIRIVPLASVVGEPHSADLALKSPAIIFSDWHLLAFSIMFSSLSL